MKLWGMMNFEGKKAFCFPALKHHSRFYYPLPTLEERGMTIKHSHRAGGNAI